MAQPLRPPSPLQQPPIAAEELSPQSMQRQPSLRKHKQLHPSIRLQLFPHSDIPLHQQTSRNKPFLFNPVEHDIALGTVLRVGRKVDRNYGGSGTAAAAATSAAAAAGSSVPGMSNGTARDSKPTTREQRAANNVSLSEDPQQAGFVTPVHTGIAAGSSNSAGPSVGINNGPNGNLVKIGTRRTASEGPFDPASPRNTIEHTDTPQDDPYARNSATGSLYVAFRSKVVSRTHAEIWVGRDGQIYFKDIGSSSGTFLNRLRLSPSGKESRPYPLKSGDVIQLGVDYQGRSEEIYRAVTIKIFITVKNGTQTRASPQRLRSAITSLISAMNPNNPDEDSSSTDCCICLGPMAPLQALFLAPCSHCFHYKCVTPLLGTGYMFQCPMCRQVANLDATTSAELDDSPIIIEHEDHLTHGYRVPPGDLPLSNGADPTSSSYHLASTRSSLAEDTLATAAAETAAATTTTAASASAVTVDENRDYDVGSPTSVHASHTLSRRPRRTTVAIPRNDSEFTHVPAEESSPLAASMTEAALGASTNTSGSTGPFSGSTSGSSTMPIGIPIRTFPLNINPLSNRFDAMSATTPPNHSMSVPIPTHHSSSTDSTSLTPQSGTHANSRLPPTTALVSLSGALSRGDWTAASLAVDTYGKAVTDLLDDTQNPLSDEDREALRERLIQSLILARRQ
ncbi:hypothetical protein BASA50_001871 [Batrachochytrium salamandrivorans]|uniref:FHA domain-containing protein n=1 Tax=Batrachochytrium salamandrivorans TaxID=1357716 RepID=A0ABQ8FMV1_9FUNG|nr:hypothetical protein BASA60_006385 [Batrachochytrium salamandrivorans]KAH6577862.1 hypothetical protein BASA62_000652 [Batrachochytrium salamandrivorans]KAH6590324.1 hypothetical protein BASA61_005320 [Batrachochytrium salamandrivorans]KAH6601043.1 hypothetical protein BASA50_001871 [Batrachochytrium salamandrivorans]KAH9264833.1 hypothetical protein BASA83_011659 [Batrachochytrium salamandrivorans]